MFDIKNFSKIIILCCLFSALKAAAQTNTQPNTRQENTQQEQEIISVGAYGGYGINILTGSFLIDHGGGLTNTQSCGLYEKGNGKGFAFGNIISKKIFPSFSLTLSPEYSVRDGVFSFDCIDPANIRLPNGSTEQAITRNVAEVSHSLLSFRLNAEHQPIQNLPLRIILGPTFSFGLGARYIAHEDIVTPINAEFVSGGQSHFFGNRDFTDSKSFSYGYNIGAKYLLPVAKNLHLFFEVSYMGGYGKEINSANIVSNQLRGCLGIINTFTKATEPPKDTVKKIDTTAAEPALHLALSAEAVYANNQTSDNIKLQGQRVITSELYPLLNYIFYDSTNVDLPPKFKVYTNESFKNFSINNLQGLGVLETYFNLLNIVAYRLKQSTGAVLKVKARVTEGDTKLATERANLIQKYLVNVCQVPKNQISVSVDNLKENLSNAETEDGKAENKRVELYCNKPEVLSSVLISDTVFKAISPELNFATTVEKNEFVDNWELQVSNGSKVLSQLKGNGKIPNKIEWKDINKLRLDKLGEIVVDKQPTSSNELKAVLTATTKSGKKYRAETLIPISKSIIDNNLRFGSGNFSLILFDYNSSSLKEEHNAAIDIVNSRTDKNTKTYVEGYTDRLGEEGLNLTLSQARADAVSTKLRSNVVSVVGKGEVELYDNNTPEGRFYSRTVTIRTED